MIANHHDLRLRNRSNPKVTRVVGSGVIPKNSAESQLRSNTNGSKGKIAIQQGINKYKDKEDILNKEYLISLGFVF